MFRYDAKFSLNRLKPAKKVLKSKTVCSVDYIYSADTFVQSAFNPMGVTPKSAGIMQVHQLCQICRSTSSAAFNSRRCSVCPHGESSALLSYISQNATGPPAQKGCMHIDIRFFGLHLSVKPFMFLYVFICSCSK